ncbi:MAG: ABC transporter substrate-binding protein [Anaerolineaceae bacterium]|nr:ABC transporter substrate-binding protein [Anaerolineaceae bacterium]MDE0329554.1 ABC transporter substrate-binding protein [Anaerolineaceae bacterium]MDE0610086.1 ABC transporter substrate-binding protein [Anaerolineaceae bacterium]
MLRKMLSLTLVLLLILVSGSVSAQEPRQGGTLVVAAEIMGDSLDIGFWHGFGGLHVIDSIGEGLVQADFETGAAKPGLAESWTISDDGLVYTFNIRPDMVFHDGEPVTAQAVVRSMLRPVSTDDPSYIEGMYMYFNQGFDNWESLEALDDLTVQLTLKQPNATQLLVFTRPDGYIISPKAMDEYGQEVGLNMSMAGPYRVERFVPGQEAVLAANEDYWAGRPWLDQIIIRAWPDEASILAALEAGEVDLTLYAPFTSVDRITADEGDDLRIEVGAPLVNLFMPLNVTQAPLDNVLVRRAVNHAIDRDAIIEGGLSGLAQHPASILGPNDLGFDPAGMETSRYDPDLARELLAESGLETPIPVTVTFENNRFWPLLAELVAVDLEAVGFDVTLDRLDTGSFLGKVNEGLAQISMTQRSTFLPDPHDKAIILNTVYGGGQTHHAGLESAAYLNELVDNGIAVVDPAARAEVYQEIQALALDMMIMAYLGYLQPPIFVREHVQGVDTQGTAAGRANFRNVWLDQ